MSSCSSQFCDVFDFLARRARNFFRKRGKGKGEVGVQGHFCSDVSPTTKVEKQRMTRKGQKLSAMKSNRT